MFDFDLYTQMSDSGPHGPLVFVMQWTFSLQNGINIFFLRMSLRFSYNSKARHINIIISKLDTNNTYFTYLRTLFLQFFLMFLRNGAAVYEMESVSLSLTV